VPGLKPGLSFEHEAVPILWRMSADLSIGEDGFASAGGVDVDGGLGR